MSRHDTDYKGVRSFQPSRTLSRVMDNDFENNPDIVYYEVQYLYGNDTFLISSDYQKVLDRKHHICNIFDLNLDVMLFGN